MLGQNAAAEQRGGTPNRVSARLRLPNILPMIAVEGSVMVMRVDLQTYGLEAPERSKTSRAANSSAAKPERAAMADQASFSFDQVRLQSLEKQVMAQPEVRGDKVEAVRQALGKGEYAVSDGQIADAIVADLRGGSQG